MATLPGIEYLGKGFNLLGPNGIRPTAGDTKTIFNLVMDDSYNIKDTVYEKPSVAEVFPDNGYKGKLTFSKTVIQATKKFTATFGLEAEYGDFSANVDSSFSEETRESTDTAILMIEDEILGYSVTLDSKQSISTLNFTEAFKAALDGTMNPKELFERYGTHFIKGVRLGGKVIALSSSISTEKVEEKEFTVSAKAKYDGVVSVEATASYTKSNKSKVNSESIKQELMVYGGAANLQIALQKAPSPTAFKDWAASVEKTPTFSYITAVGPIWDLCKDDNRKKQLENAYKLLFTQRALANLQLFKFTSVEATSQLSANLTVPDGYKILSGGAKVKTTGAGFLLFASYPQSTKEWQADARDHLVSSTGTLEIGVISVYDPFDLLEVKIQKSVASPSAAVPTAEIYVDVKSGYKLVGGGAKVTWIDTAGNFLTASYPSDDGKKWIVKSKHHHYECRATITAYAIVIKPKLEAIKIDTMISDKESHQAQKPETSISEESGYQLVGGGAKANYKGFGSLLTASYPETHEEWFVKSQDHHKADFCTITAYAINMKVT